MFNRNMWIKNDSKKAFTLIEMLVVIFVLWIGILSITVLITRNLSLVKNIHTQTTATILAREGIEMTYNVRDTNIILWYDWNCAERLDICETYMRTWDEENHRFIIEWWLWTNKQIILSGINWSNFDILFENSKLYLTWITQPTNITWYTHIWNGDSTIARYIEFTWLNSIPVNSPIKKTDIHKIKSVVLYNLNNTLTWEIVLESFITNKD